MLAHLVQLGHGVDYVIAHIIGVGGQEANTFYAVYLVDGSQQVAQVRSTR